LKKRYNDTVEKIKKDDKICKLLEGRICKISRDAFDAGFRDSLVECSGGFYVTCEVFMKARDGKTLEEILGLT